MGHQNLDSVRGPRNVQVPTADIFASEFSVTVGTKSEIKPRPKMIDVVISHIRYYIVHTYLYFLFTYTLTL